MRVLILTALVAALTLSHGADSPCRARGCTRATEVRQVSFGPVAELGPQLSPDGQTVAFEYFHEDHPNLPEIWIMPVSGGFVKARPLVDDSNYNAEFSWSPDGNWLCYFTSSMIDGIKTSQIYKVNARDGTTQQITRFEKGRPLSDSTSWSSDGSIAFENNYDIYTVKASGGSAMKLVDVRSRFPTLTPSEIRWSPDGLRLAFTGTDEGIGSVQSRIWLANVKDQAIVPVTDSKWDSTPSWLDNSRILFSRGFSKNETKVCLLTLDTSEIECLTDGGVDLSPWGDARSGELFFARGATHSTINNPGFFAGFHIWTSQIVK